jgi:hypothetical protein
MCGSSSSGVQEIAGNLGECGARILHQLQRSIAEAILGNRDLGEPPIALVACGARE